MNPNVPDKFQNMISYIEHLMEIMKVQFPEFYLYWNRSYKYWKKQTVHLQKEKHMHPYFWIPTFKLQLYHAITEMERNYTVQKSTVGDYEYFLSFITTMRRLGVI